MKLEKEQLAELKSAIEWQELCRNGLRQVNMGFARITKLKVVRMPLDNYSDDIDLIPVEHMATYNLTIGIEGEYETKHKNCHIDLSFQIMKYIHRVKSN